MGIPRPRVRCLPAPRSTAAVAQFFIPPEISKLVYQRLPDLPQENQYISKESGEVAANNTLVNRLIRYHVYGKKRLPNYRFDWKLTMADYLGAYDYLVASQYPVEYLNRKSDERGYRSDRTINSCRTDALVSVLVSIFNPWHRKLLHQSRAQNHHLPHHHLPQPPIPTSPATTSNPRRGVSFT